MYSRHDLIQAVREMMERQWDAYEIASRMNLDADDVQAIIDLITRLVT